MRRYYINISIVIKLFLMGQVLVNKKVDIPIPPIEKGVNETVETLTEEIYDCIICSIHNCISNVEDLQLELVVDYPSITFRYEKQLVDKRVIFDSNSAIFDDRIKYCMVMVERELTKRLTEVSQHLYE